jgi:hypothetical protein
VYEGCDGDGDGDGDGDAGGAGGAGGARVFIRLARVGLEVPPG